MEINDYLGKIFNTQWLQICNYNEEKKAIQMYEYFEKEMNLKPCDNIFDRMKQILYYSDGNYVAKPFLKAIVKMYGAELQPLIEINGRAINIKVQYKEGFEKYIKNIYPHATVEVQ
jgi:hypothetical protein